MAFSFSRFSRYAAALECHAKMSRHSGSSFHSTPGYDCRTRCASANIRSIEQTPANGMVNYRLQIVYAARTRGKRSKTQGMVIRTFCNRSPATSSIPVCSRVLPGCRHHCIHLVCTHLVFLLAQSTKQCNVYCHQSELFIQIICEPNA